MRNPFLSAFKSLEEVDDSIVAKEKRIIKESLEESDYKEDEDIVEIDDSPIENSFTASNLYDGLEDIDEFEEDEELEEDILTEKLPKDLAKAYRKIDEYRSRFSGDDRRQARIDYEKAEYKEITPEEAIQARKDGRIQDLRILKDGQLILYREDAYPLTGIEWVKREDRFTNRNGKVIADTRLMPPTHVFKIADKIYLTNEKDNYFPMGKWVDGDYIYDDPTQQHRLQQRKDLIPDTGAHSPKRNKDSWGEPDYYEKRANEYKDSVIKVQSQLDALEDKWENGDISRNDYQSEKEELEKKLNDYKKWEKENRDDAIKARGIKATKKAEDRFALSRKDLRKNIDKYNSLKDDIKSAEYALNRVKERGGVYSWELKGGSYDEKIKKIESLKAQMDSIKKELEKLQAEANDTLKQSNLDQNTKALNDAQKKVDDLKSELSDLLGRAHKYSGKEESLNEAMVDLKDLEQVEEVKAARDEEKEKAPIEQIVDPNATIVNELEPSYVGKAILECTKCFGHHYMDPKDLEVSEEKNSDGDQIYNIDFECPTCHAKDGFLLVGQVAALEDEDKEVDSEEEEENNAPKILKPEKEEEPKEEEVTVDEVTTDEVVEESLTDFDEVSFDSHMTKYLTEVYSNVESYKSTEGSLTDKGMVIEGLITFKSGKEKPTTFRLSIEDNGKINGLNEAFDKDNNIYTIEGKIENNTFITENIIYKYNIGDELIEGFTKVEEKEETTEETNKD